MRLSDGHLALGCARRCRTHLAHRVPRLLAPERLQWPSNFDGGSDLLGPLVSGGFHGLCRWCIGGSKSAPRSGTGMADVPELMAGERCWRALLTSSLGISGW